VFLVDTIKRSFNIAKRRPVLLLIWGLVFLVTGIIAQLNPLINLIINFGTQGKGNIFETIMTSVKLALKFLFGSGYLSLTLLTLTGGLVLVSLLLGVVFSGGFHVINSEMKGNTRRSFTEGVKNYFLKFAVVNFTVTPFSHTLF
jgi:hypothetical protein